MGGWRLGADIGGTFTDLVLMDAERGGLRVLKVPSTPRRPAEAVVRGAAEIAALAGVPPRAIDLFVHGTTLAVNTLIQRSGAPIGLLVTAGFEDMMELGRLRLPEPQNFFTDRPQPLVAREAVRGIRERTAADGAVLQPADLDQAEAAAGELRASGLRALAVCFLHAYRNERNERDVGERIRARYPDLFVRLSSEVWPQRREYERALLTAVDAHIGPAMAAYFGDLEDELRRADLRCPILSTKSNGGVMTARSAALRPAETLFSGPAAGVVGAIGVAAAAGFPDVVTLDIGGTSADVSIVRDGRPAYSTESKSGDFPIVLPAVDLQTIGAGGGSIARVDARGVLKVGPQSAGADPGPACYGRGGEEATITDAYLTLGILGPEGLLGGAQPLDLELARAAIGRLGAAMGVGAPEAAWAVVAVATATMYARFIPLLASRGADADRFALLAYGGAGPTHGLMLAEEVGIRRVLVPPLPGALCALGCLTADVRADFVRTFAGDLEGGFAALEAEARAWLRDEGIPVDAARVERSAEMRYRGQSFEINVPVTGDLAGDFHRAYEAIYGYADPEAPFEVVDLRVQVVGVTPKPRAERAGPGEAVDALPRGRRPVFHDGRWREVGLYDRSELQPGHRLAGPAIVSQYDTTTFLPPGWRCRIDGFGNIVAERD